MIVEGAPIATALFVTSTQLHHVNNAEGPARTIRMPNMMVQDINLREYRCHFGLNIVVDATLAVFFQALHSSRIVL